MSSQQESFMRENGPGSSLFQAFAVFAVGMTAFMAVLLISTH